MDSSFRGAILGNTARAPGQPDKVGGQGSAPWATVGASVEHEPPSHPTRGQKALGNWWADGLCGTQGGPRHRVLELAGGIRPCPTGRRGRGLSGSREHAPHHSTAFWIIGNAGRDSGLSHLSPCASDPVIALTSKPAFCQQQEGGNEA